MGHKFPKGSTQLDSPFFQKLPLEIRRTIYTELFGSSSIHVKFSTASGPWEGSSFPRAGHPTRAMPSLWHCLCRHPGATPHCHEERNHKWLYLAPELIFTCKKAYEEGIAILYGTNTFIFENESDWRTFSQQADLYIKIIRSLDFVICHRNVPDFDIVFEMKSICRTLFRASLLQKARFLIKNEHRRQLMDFEAVLKPLKSLGTHQRHDWPHPIHKHFEIFLKKSAKKHIEAIFNLAVENLGLQGRVSAIFNGRPRITAKPFEDSDDEDFGLQQFDGWYPDMPPPMADGWGMPWGPNADSDDVPSDA